MNFTRILLRIYHLPEYHPLVPNDVTKLFISHPPYHSRSVALLFIHLRPRPTTFFLLFALMSLYVLWLLMKECLTGLSFGYLLFVFVFVLYFLQLCSFIITTYFFMAIQKSFGGFFTLLYMLYIPTLLAHTSLWLFEGKRSKTSKKILSLLKS